MCLGRPVGAFIIYRMEMWFRQRVESYVTAYVGNAIELSIDAKALIVYTKRQVIGVLRSTRITVRCAIILINNTVTIEVGNNVLTRKFLVVPLSK